MASTMRSITDALQHDALRQSALHQAGLHQTALRSVAPERRHLRQAVHPLRHRASVAEPSWLEIRDAVTAHRIDIPRTRRCIVRVLDLVVSLIALLLSTPVLLVIAIVIAVTSPGAPIYVHWRVSRGGGMFPCLKFRTMYERPESHAGVAGCGLRRAHRHLHRDT